MGSWDYAGKPDVVWIDPKVDFDWHSFGRNDPLPPEIADDGAWSADWKGYINIADDGVHSFTLNSDDGSRLYIDEELVVDNGGAANIQLYWRPPGASSDTIVPTDVLFLGPNPPLPELPTLVLVVSGIVMIDF